jgi:hypothetical protein
LNGDGTACLKEFLSLYQSAKLIAVGRVAERVLRRLGHNVTYVRHPSHGGKAAFEGGMVKLVVMAKRWSNSS